MYLPLAFPFPVLGLHLCYFCHDMHPTTFHLHMFKVQFTPRLPIIPREVPCSALKGETVPDSLPAESSDELLFKDHDFSSDLLRQLNDLRQNRILTDVSICAGSWEVPCHRNVLASSSPYFRAMFCSNFRESREAKVQLKGVDASTLERIILYVYTGEAHITVESVLPLMEAASMLQYPKLLEACSSFLQNQLTPSNCLGMTRLSDIFSCETLRKKARVHG